MNGNSILAALENIESGEFLDSESLLLRLNNEPYNAALRLLYLKALQKEKALKLPFEIQKASAFLPSRKILHKHFYTPLAQPIPVLEGRDEMAVNSKVKSDTSVNPASIQLESTKDRIKAILEANRKMRSKIDDEKIENKKNETTEILNPTIIIASKNTQEVGEEQYRLLDKEILTNGGITIEGDPSDSNHEKSASLEFKEELKNLGSKELEVVSNIYSKDDSQKPNLETHSILQWMHLLNNQKSNNRKNKVVEQLDAIDGFLEALPKLKPDPNKPQRNDVLLIDNKSDNEMVTETLAKLYLEQGYLKKARQAFEILSLRFPEKSSFFAAQIKQIKILQKEKGKK